MKRAVATSLLAGWLIACSGEPEQSDRRVVAAKSSELTAAAYGTEVEIPAVLRGLPLIHDDAGSAVATTPCTTCHAASDARPLPTSAEQLGGPHAGLSVRHGELRCASCHEQQRRDQLHLADGRSIPLSEAMQLCGQCHGTQKRDYDHGAHGGMRGYWDLSRGPRARNHCVSCHDPHAPRFGTFMPVAPPRDRFSGHRAEEADDHE